MSDRPSDLERLIAEAIEDSRDEGLDGERLEEIRQFLLTSSEARKIYLKHNRFSRMLAAEDIPPAASDEAIAAGDSIVAIESASRPLTRRPVTRRFAAYAGWAVAATVLIAGLLAWQFGQRESNSDVAGRPIVDDVTEPPMAVLTRAIGIEWEHPSRHQADLGQPITERWLRVKSGIAEVSFSSGATVSIEGPARLRLDSAMYVFSKSGKLAANCPPSAHGFTVRFRGGKVVDLGTEFALDSDPEGKTRVHVLSGEVIVALTDEDNAVLQEQNLKGNSAVVLNPDAKAIDSIEYDAKPYSEMHRDALIHSQPIKLQFDLGHRAGLYKGTNAPAHAAGDMFAHEDVWTQIVGDQSGTFVMADGNICPHPIRIDYGHGDELIDWDAIPIDPMGRIYKKVRGVFDSALCQDHRPSDFDLGLRVSGLPAGNYRIYALCRSVRRPEASYDVSFGSNLDQQLSEPMEVIPLTDAGAENWIAGQTHAVGEVQISGPDDWATFITRYSSQRSIITTSHPTRSVLLGLQIVQTESNQR